MVDAVDEAATGAGKAKAALMALAGQSEAAYVYTQSLLAALSSSSPPPLSLLLRRLC